MQQSEQPHDHVEGQSVGVGGGVVGGGGDRGPGGGVGRLI